jgi:hypothetical protein
MKKNLIIRVLTVSAAVLGLVLAFAQPQSVYASSDLRGGPGTGRGNSAAAPRLASSTALTPLSADETAVLQLAILEEYGALNLYQSVVAQYGNIIPFSGIALAEQQHVNALVRQAEKYGVEVPENPGTANSVSFTSVTAACQAGVDAEIADAALYDDLMSVTTHSDLLQVYTSLQSASLNSHLPAFDLCN